MGKIIVKQSRSIGDRLPATFQYFFNEWKGLLAPFLMYVAPILLIILGYVGAVTQTMLGSLESMEIEDPSDIMGMFETLGFSGTSMFAIVILSLLSSVLSYSIFGSYIALREESDFQPSPKDVLSNALPKMLPVFIMLILTAISVMAGAFLFFIGSIIVMVLFAAAYPVIFMEDTNGAKAISRSFQLCKKNFFDTLFFFIILIITVLFTSILISFALSPLSTIGMAFYESNAILGIIIIGITSLVGQVINILIYIGQFLHYGHIVEKTENNSLENEIMAL